MELVTDIHLPAPLKPLRFASHSKTVQKITTTHGWLPGARYTNLRDVRDFDEIGFIDIDWKNYNFQSHLAAVKTIKPLLTVARDVLNIEELSIVLDEAEELKMWAKDVMIVPKCPNMAEELEYIIPKKFLLGYSTPTKYGETPIPPEKFLRPVHLLGGRPQDQIALAKTMRIHSFDCNRFTLDAQFGDYFDGSRFRPHPVGGYLTCIEASVKSINSAWSALEEQ